MGCFQVFYYYEESCCEHPRTCLVPISVGIYLRVESLGHWVGMCLASVAAAKQFSNSAFTDLSSCLQSMSVFIVLYLANAVIDLFNFSYSNTCVVVAHCGFNLRFPDD